jgi:hypothetical protein
MSILSIWRRLVRYKTLPASNIQVLLYPVFTGLLNMPGGEIMKKFVLQHIGFVQPTEEIMAAWGKWFEDISGVTVENVGLMAGAEITSGGVNDLVFDSQVMTGYTVIEVENLDEAIKIAQDCPFITGIKVQEVRSM